jgi:hypothetical protein
MCPTLMPCGLDLGIQISHGIVSIDDTARLADIRRAITRTPADHTTR